MTKYVALISGKGGVGKTTSTINLAKALVELDKSVVVVDANLMTPNIGLHLGVLSPEATVNSVLRKEHSIDQALHSHDSGVSFIPASSSYEEFQNTKVKHISKIFQKLDNTVDFVLVDCPSGLGVDVDSVLKHCDEALVVTTPTLSSVIEALKSMEVAKSHNNIVAGIILNMTNRGRNELTSDEVMSLLRQPVIASLKNCRKVRKASHYYVPLHSMYPRSKSSKQYTEVAKHISMEY